MHLLIDGYNAIHANPKLKNILEEHSQEAATKALSDIVASIHDSENCRTTIVFDGKGDKLEVLRRSNIQTFSEVYTPSDMTADDFIEQYCAQHTKDCTVATADRLLDITAGFFGANIISPIALFEWAKQCSQKIQNKNRENNKNNSISWKDTNPFLAIKTEEVPRKNVVKKEIQKTKLLPCNKLKKNVQKYSPKNKLSWNNPKPTLELSETLPKSKRNKEATLADENPFLRLNIKGKI
ncbi:MAG: NYN domain-containing protein [Opitutales bacterium]